MQRFWSTCFLVFVSLLINACGDSGPSKGNESAQKIVEKPKPYTELGDLEAIRQHKTLRLIAPRFDGADALPREGVSVRAYQQVAEAFAAHLQLAVQWVYVDGFDDLLVTLNEGRGDLVVTNMTVTASRQQQADFSKSINRVNEVLVGLQDLTLDDVEYLEGLTVGVPAGTAYLESLQALLEKDPDLFTLKVLESSASQSDVLDAISAGEYQATVMDSDMARVLLRDYPGLKLGGTITKNRTIAWAVRQQSPQLLNELNQFLVSHHVTQSTQEFELRDWEQIKQQGHLRMLTLNNPASYFMWRGELMGFDYDLMRRFAADHGLHLAVIMKDSIPELLNALAQGEGDVIAASITRSQERESKGVVFSNRYLKVSEQLVSMADGPKAETMDDLAGHRVGINPNTVFYKRLKALPQSADFDIIEFPGVTTETLINKLENGEFDFTISDSHLLAIEQAHNKDIESQFNVTDESEIAWGLRKDQPLLSDKLNQFIGKQYRGLFYNVTFNKYFKSQRKIKKYSAQRVVPGEALSPYDDMVKPLAKQYGMDWRLIIAQMYQESRFNPKAKSFAGAQGLMQVLPRTAKEMGFSNLNEPANGIGAGLAYMNWLRDRFPGEMDLQERLYFTLAAYNAGTGHVRDARRLARKLGKDPDRWFGNVEEAMLLLSQPRYFRQARFGYVRGSEPVEYVRRIRDRYLAYLAATR